ncbi:hypothetical protein E2C01_067135 [Portunus trituberculatus]|uniref:Uncharacterized protein n=1 Tax=Portunus trituberculatus TaxID=210409 RepID=A0A5B7HJ07_PORTR|nr:hypothetical protein [Portunus trituberculatus]
MARSRCNTTMNTAASPTRHPPSHPPALSPSRPPTHHQHHHHPSTFPLASSLFVAKQPTLPSSRHFPPPSCHGRPGHSSEFLGVV